MSAQPTEGRWYAARGVSQMVSTDTTLAEVGRKDADGASWFVFAASERHGDAEADARLFAASKDMLAQLREAREYVKAQRDCLANSHTNPATGNLHPADVCAEDDALLARLDAVIAKATGAA